MMKSNDVNTALSEASVKLTASHKMLDNLFTVAFDKTLDPQLPTDQQRILRLWPVVSEMVNAAFCDLDDYLRIIHEIEFETASEPEETQEVSA